MNRCRNCGEVFKDTDIFYWQCNNCGKVFKLNYLKLKNINTKKEQMGNRSLMKCPSCSSVLDDGTEKIAYKCMACGNTVQGNLKSFVCEDADICDTEKNVLDNPNLIKCPKCGKAISKRAKRCVHCGKVLIDEIMPKLFCSDCGKEVPFDAKECPYCGCPVENDNEESVSRLKKDIRKNIKKAIVPIMGFGAILLIIFLIVNFMVSNLSEDEQLAYQNAVTMKKMMRDPDSFKLYDEMFLLKHYDDGNIDYTYTIFKYGGANGYGAVTTDEAIFKNGDYIMDYADEPDEDNPNYMEQVKVKADLAMYVLTGGDGDIWEKIDIDIEKIKKKMEIE